MLSALAGRAPHRNAHLHSKCRVQQMSRPLREVWQQPLAAYTRRSPSHGWLVAPLPHTRHTLCDTWHYNHSTHAAKQGTLREGTPIGGAQEGVCVEAAGCRHGSDIQGRLVPQLCDPGKALTLGWSTANVDETRKCIYRRHDPHWARPSAPQA